MKLRYFGVTLLVALVMAFTITSCTEEWDSHYDTLSAGKSELNLYDYIKSQPDLSTFANMLQITGYDSILSKPQTFTVWAPSNEALNGLNTSDPAQALEIVKNHITRFSYTTSGISRSIMLMLNSKLITFEKQGDGYYFNDLRIVKPDLAASNGILHVINQYAPYRKNLWEFINSASGLDSLRTYVNSLTRREFDVDASYKDGVFV
ncbi:MAG TPA: fasciclin domain-containing protein, partial [Paludibacteraceae bacterium]|nr:fasciclin domain-containing protein [Paludibacteraceae bacterium]